MRNKAGEFMPNSSPKMPARQVTILVFDGVQPIDFSGPAQALITANEEGASPQYVVNVRAFTGEKIQTASGFSINAEPIDLDLDIDTLIIPGGPGVHDGAQKNSEFRNALHQLCERSKRICSICTGAFLLAQAGMLANRRAVTHWRSCERLSHEFPDVQVESNSLFLKDGKVWTSAGVTAGIDLTLALIQEDHDATLAAKVARRLVVYLRRPGGQNQYSEPLSLQEASGTQYANLLQQMINKPEFSWTVEHMASIAGQSLRSFHRQFKEEVGTTPSKALEKIRTELARTYLHTTNMRMKQIATKAGFDSEDSMRDAIVRQFGLSPKEMRERF
ncbi:GlxA family transcriptional regulator [Collimonas sp. NPDC087041]|uniref:GlxA family transcriptional regulator n=1 Tax=Collimonas sp. NPDC087041 TaxID=3363960 RepID=UPI0038105A67